MMLINSNLALSSPSDTNYKPVFTFYNKITQSNSHYIPIFLQRHKQMKQVLNILTFQMSLLF